MLLQPALGLDLCRSQAENWGITGIENKTVRKAGRRAHSYAGLMWHLLGLVFLDVHCKRYEKHAFNKPQTLARHKAQPEALKLYWLHPQHPQGTPCLRGLQRRFLTCLGVLVLQLLYDKQLSPTCSSDGRYLPGKSMTKSAARGITGHTWGWILPCSWASWSGLKIKIEAASSFHWS